MENEKKVLSTLVNAQENESNEKVEGYCGKNYSSGEISCGSNYSSGGTSSASDDLDILI